MTRLAAAGVGDRLPAALAARLERYYTAYYRDALAIPVWRELVDVRLADKVYEAGRIANLERALGRPLRGCRLLNVGCGTGGFNVLAHRVGAEVSGVDASAEATALAAARSAPSRLMQAEAEALPLPGGSFDVVYCYSRLEHVADAGHAVREMIRVLKPGGQLYVHTPNRWACFEGHYKVFWLPGLPRPLSAAYLALRGRPTAFLETLRLVTLSECRSLVEAAGGRITRVLDDGARRPVGGPLWPLVRAYYRLFRIRPYVEFVAEKRRDP